MTRGKAAAVAAIAGASFFVVPGTAQAVDCGAPARPAVYQSVTIPAVDATYLTELQWTRAVLDEAAYTDFGWMRHVVDVAYDAGLPEVSHTRYEWMRQITHVEHLWRYKVIDRPAGWTTVHHDAVTHEEFVWQRTVIDTPHQDAVPEQGYDESQYSRQVVATPETTQQQLVKAAYDEQVVDVAAHTVHHPAVTHVVHHDAEYTTVVTEREYGKWNGHGWTTKWYPASANPKGWAPTGNIKTKDQLVKGAYDETVTDKAAYDETVPATYKTVHHDAVYTTVVIPATYTTEYQWAQTAPGGSWTATGEQRHVVTQDAQAEVPETSHVEKSSYSAAAPDGEGWEQTTDSTTVVDQAAYDEQVRVKAKSHWVKQWSETKPDEDHPWVQTKKSRALPSTDEFAYTDGEGTPAGSGWAKSGQTWQIVDQEAVPETPEQGHDEFGFTTSATEGPWAETTNLGWLTGQEFSHDAVTHPEYTWVVSGQSPEGDGWSVTDASRQGEQLTPGTPASSVEELVTAAEPAGAPCAATPVVDNGGAGDGGNADDPATAPAEAAPAASATPALAFTGADGTPELLGLAGLLMLVGAGLRRVARRRA